MAANPDVGSYLILAGSALLCCVRFMTSAGSGPSGE